MPNMDDYDEWFMKMRDLFETSEVEIPKNIDEDMDIIKNNAIQNGVNNTFISNYASLYNNLYKVCVSESFSSQEKEKYAKQLYDTIKSKLETNDISQLITSFKVSSNSQNTKSQNQLSSNSQNTKSQNQLSSNSQNTKSQQKPKQKVIITLENNDSITIQKELQILSDRIDKLEVGLSRNDVYSGIASSFGYDAFSNAEKQVRKISEPFFANK